VQEQPGVILCELFSQLKQATTTDFYLLVAHGEVYVNLHEQALAEPDRTKVYADPNTAVAYLHLPKPAKVKTVQPHLAAATPQLVLAVGSRLVWDGVGWTVLNVGRELVTLRSETGQLLNMMQTELEKLAGQGQLQGQTHTEEEAEQPPAVSERLRRASPADLQQAAHRYRLIEPVLEGKKVKAKLEVETPDVVLHKRERQSANIHNVIPIENTSTRTRYRWLMQYRQAETSYGAGYGFVGLLPELFKSGNRTRKLTAATLELTEKFIRDHYETIKHKGASAVYGQLLLACETAGLTPPSFKTFCLALKKRPVHEQTLLGSGC